MDRRLYFVLPDLATAQAVERDLLLARVEERRMHFVARRGTYLADLPEATLGQKSDIRHGVFVGLVSGLLVGGAIGLLLYLRPELVGIAVHPGLIVVLAAFGAVFGIATSGFLIGSSTPNVHLKEFERDFARGRIVLMLDLPRERVDDVRELIRAHFPAAEDHGIDATMPAFP